MIFPNYSLPYSWFAKSILKRVLWPHIVEKYGVEKFHTFFFPFWEFLFVGLFVCNMGYPRTMTMLARILSIWSNKHFFFFKWRNLLIKSSGKCGPDDAGDPSKPSTACNHKMSTGDQKKRGSCKKLNGSNELTSRTFTRHLCYDGHYFSSFSFTSPGLEEG